MRFSLASLLAIAAVVIPPALHAQGEDAPVSTPPDRPVIAEKPAMTHRPPAGPHVGGTWCGGGFLRGTQLNITQRHHEFEGTLVRGDRTRNVDGSIEGNTLRTSAASSGRAGELVLELLDDKLRIVTAGGPLRLIQGMAFVRGTGSSC